MHKNPISSAMFKRSVFALSVLVAFLFKGCGPTGSDTEILIGEYSSLTGTAATFGTSTHNGLLLAVDEINQAGGLLGKKVKLLTEDTQSKPEEAATGVTKLISRDQVKVVIGEVASGRSLAAAPICQASGIPMVSPASTNPKVTQVGDYIFRICYLDPFQGYVTAKFVYGTLNARRVAILKDVKNEYSIGLTEFFTEHFTKAGGEIIVEQAYSEGDNDFKAQLTALKALNPDVIFVPGYYTEVALIVKQARELKMMMPFVGGDGWDSSKLLEIGGEAMNNTYYCNHYSPEDTSSHVQQYVARYRERFNETPDALAALGYDAGMIVFDAIKRAGSTEGAKVRDALLQTRNFQGVAGVVSIDADRNATKSAVIIAIENGKSFYKETILP